MMGAASAKLVELGLAEQCNNCKGDGLFDTHDWDMRPVRRFCGECAAKGIILSDVGKLLAQLFRSPEVYK